MKKKTFKILDHVFTDIVGVNTSKWSSEHANEFEVYFLENYIGAESRVSITALDNTTNNSNVEKLDMCLITEVESCSVYQTVIEKQFYLRKNKTDYTVKLIKTMQS